MKRKMGRSALYLGLLLCVLTLCACTVFAGTEKQGDFSDSLHWTLDSKGTLTISGNGLMEDLSAAEDAPWEDVKEQIYKIVIQEGVNSIGDFAFVRSNAQEVVIPASVNYIAVDAFLQTPVQKFVVSGDSEAYSADAAGCLYNKEQDYLVRYPIGSKAKTFSVPSTVTIIGCSAFEDAEKLTSITLPDSVDWIGTWAFARCVNLKTVRMPKNLTQIDDYAFNSCAALQDAALPNTMEYIGESAFCQCESLTTVSVPAGVFYLGTGAFFGCTSLERISVDAKNQEYCSDDNGCLYNKDKTLLMQYPCGRKAGSFAVPDGVKTIDENAFNSSGLLQTLSLPNSVIEIKDSAFYGCDQLQKITLSKNLKTIEGYAFMNCKALTSITIPNTVTSIGDSAFCSCESLRKVTLSSALQTIARDTFEYCIALKSITIPKAVTSIEKNAFSNCYALKQIKILNAACNIKGGAGTVYKSAFIYGQKGSAAQKYADQYNRTFCTIDAEGVHTHTCQTVITPAKYHKDGKKARVCKECGQTQSKTVIPAVQEIKLSKTKLKYNGKKQLPKVTVKNKDGKKLKLDRDYTLKYASGSKKVGTYQVTITFKGNYTGKKTRTYKIVSAS